MMERLDKILCNSNIGSRKECDKLIKRGAVCVDGVEIKKPETKVCDGSKITVCGEPVVRFRTAVCIMNKPSGYVTSTDDPRDVTVMELLPEEFLNLKVVPAGRLDKDTEGLLVFSNDGEFIHKLISPKSGVSKTYFVEHEGIVAPEAVNQLCEGVVLKDGTVCRSAHVEIIDEHKSRITVTEGMYHQVRRMFAAIGCHVTFLKREKIGTISLEGLEPGMVRELDDFEIKMLFESK